MAADGTVVVGSISQGGSEQLSAGMYVQNLQTSLLAMWHRPSRYLPQSQCTQPEFVLFLFVCLFLLVAGATDLRI